MIASLIMILINISRQDLVSKENFIHHLNSEMKFYKNENISSQHSEKETYMKDVETPANFDINIYQEDHHHRKLVGTIDSSKSTISGTGSIIAERYKSVSLIVQAKDSSSNKITTGGSILFASVQNICTKTGYLVCQQPDTFTDLNVNIYTQMTDNGDGTYSTNFKCDIAGTLTVTIYLMVNQPYVEYYNNIMFAAPITSTGYLSSMNQNWGATAIIPCCTNNVALNMYFSLKSPVTGSINFQLDSQDGSDLYMNDNRFVSKLGSTCTCSDTFVQSLASNTFYDFKINYAEMNSNAYIKLYWNQTGSMQIIPNTYIFHKEYVSNSPFNITVACLSLYDGDNSQHPGECYEICGDGHRIGREICDDGNTNNGDGCNSKCSQIEDPNWICTGGEYGSKDICTKCTSGYGRNSALSQCVQTPVPDSAKNFVKIVHGLVAVEIFFCFLYSILTKTTMQSMFTMITFIQLIVLFYAFDMNMPSELNGVIQELKGYLMSLSFLNLDGMKDYSYPSCDFFNLKISMCKTLGLIGFESIYAYNNIVAPFLFFMIIFPLHLLFLFIYFLHLKNRKYKNILEPNKAMWYIFRFTTFTFYIRFFQLFYVLMLMSSVSELTSCFAGVGNKGGSCFFASMLFLACFLISVCTSWQFFKSQYNYTFFKMVYFREMFRGIRIKWEARYYVPVSVLRKFLLVVSCIGFYQSTLKVKFGFFIMFQLMYKSKILIEHVYKI